MLQVAFYFLKVIICSAGLFSYYWFFLRNKVFHSYNRFYLLAIVAISLAAPVIKINVWHNPAEGQTGVIKMLQVVNSNDEYMDEIILYSQYNHISKEKIFMITYLLVSFILGMIFLRLLFRIRKLLKENTARQIDDVYFIKTHAKGTPFSFLKFIFWNEAIDLETRAGQQIFKHELAHVQEKHSYDKLFINVILIFAWCNPFFWLVRKELNIIHEFIADQKAVEDGNSADFAAMILKATYPQFNFPLANHFFYSPIKRRLMMLTKQNKTQFNYLSRLIVLPVALIVLAAFTIKAKTSPLGTSGITNAKITVVIDPGHGGTDRGAKALDGSLEKDLCLEYAKKIKALNQNENIHIVLTRESDIYMTPKEKAAFARNAGADLLISVHMSSADPRSKDEHNGMEIYVAKDQYNNSEASKLFASAIIGSFQNNYQLKIPSNPMQRATGIWILQESQCPAVLIEAGFLSDKKDLTYLKTEKASETFAKNVLSAIEQFQSTKTFSTRQSSPAETVSNTASLVEYSNAYAQKPVLNKNENQLANEYKQKYPEENKMPSYKNTLQQAKNETRIDASQAIWPDDDKMGYAIGSTHVNQEPSITLSGISRTQINISELKNIKELKLSNPDYKIVSGTVYFVGPGFPNPASAEIRGESLNNLEPLFKKIEAGSRIVFDNVKISKKDGSGLMVIKEKAFDFYDPKKEVPLYNPMGINSADTDPEFPGGKDEWQKFLRKNLNPATPLDEGWAEGTYKIIVQFMVDKEGNVSDVKTENYTNSKTALHCIELIQNGPKWIPAKKDGIFVNAIKKQPITFVITEQ